MKLIGNTTTRIVRNFINQFSYFASIILLIVSILFVPGAGKLSGNADVAFAASDPVIAAAGDIACDPANSAFNNGNGNSGACRQKYTSDLLVNAGLEAVLPLGDVQYFCGGYQAFLQSYDLSWGRIKSISRPVVGNHEYLTYPDSPSGVGTGCDPTNQGAAGYFNYFGSAAGDPTKGYYSYDIGTWHLIALNSNCGDAGGSSGTGCGANSSQGKWLADDLASHSNYCTLAYWHVPLFSSGGRAETKTRDIWQILYNNGADVILNGHDHIYERFAPQAPNGVVDNVGGMREFIIGSGGANHTVLDTIAANSELRNIDTYGVLKLTLHPTSYDWKFVPEAGKTFTDSGTEQCHGITPDTIPPTAPSNLTASASAWNQVNLSWAAGTDNKAVTGYQIFRNGVQIGNSSGTFYTDNTVQAQMTYSYSVKAVDGVGLVSLASNLATVTTPEQPPVIVVTPAADAEIQSANPTLNSGASVQFVVDNDPIKNALLKFTVAGVGTQPIVSAKLRLYCIDPSPFGGEFHRVTNTTWSETSITWNTAPAGDSAILASLGKVSANNWYEVDLTSLVTGDGVYGLRINSTSTDGAAYSSKEGSFAPQLVITLAKPSVPTDTPTPTATATQTSTPTSTPSSTLFSDGFETGSLSQWSSGQGLVVQNQEIASGSFAARGISAGGGATYVRKLLSASQSDLYYKIRFKVISQGANTVNLMKFRSAADTAILSVSINNLGNLAYRNDLTAMSSNSLVPVSPGSWQTLQVHVRIAGTASQIDVWYNNALVISQAEPLGTTPIGVLQLGENTPALTYDIAFDDVSAFLSSGGTPTPTATQTPTSASTPTASQTSTAAPTYTSTSTPTATQTSTNTPTTTNTPTQTPTLTPTATQTATPTNTATSGSVLTFTPIADTYVQSDTPATNYGSSSQFVVDNSPIRNMFLKFNVAGIGSRSIASVKLRLYCVDGSPFGGEFHRVADTTWNESSLNWNTAPAADAAILTSLGKVAANTWYEVDVTSLVIGDGTFSLKMNSSNGDGAYYSTKEGSAGFAPQLIVTTSSVTPTPTSSIPTSTSTATATQTPTSTGSSVLTFTSAADTYVESGIPTTNFGSASQFVTDSSPVRNMLLKFNISGIGNKPVLNVKLRLYCVDGSPFGGEFHRIANTTWNESTVNWNTAPTADAAILASLGKVTANAWVEVDVTSLVTGDGTFSLKINSTNTDGAYYSTKEGIAGFAPQLVITTGAQPTNTPTASATPTQTPVDTSTPTPTDLPTLTPTATETDTPIPLDTSTPTSTP